MNAMQLDFFREVNEDVLEEDRLTKCETQLGNLRRGVFARIGDLANGMVEMMYEIDRLALKLDEVTLKLEKLERKTENE